MRTATGKKRTKTRSVLRMSCDRARKFFLEPSSYCGIDLPSYFDFSTLLNDVSKVLSTKRIKDFHFQNQTPRDYDNVNHSLYNNKDGKYAWRPLQIIHPAIYVSLVNEITSPSNWQTIRNRFREFQANPNLKCLSLPLKSLTKQSNKAEQVANWWNCVEQASLEMSLDFDHTFHTDIVDCYGAIYTHSIAWALHTKEIAKEPRNRKNSALIGNIIDWHMQDMRYGQTNGIPQGSVLMDFIAEVVLGYADLEITQRINRSGISDYKILRYRDDFRIFTNSSQDGERILKIITEVMIHLGLKLSTEKTKVSNSVVVASIKRDKLDWMTRKQSEPDLQKHLIIIHSHSCEHPNSGSLINALDHFYRRIIKFKVVNNPMPIIGVLVDIAFHNPRTYPNFAAILSKLLMSLPSVEERHQVVEKIKRKFEKLPNTGHMQLWLQRISHPICKDILYEEPLCQLVSGGSPVIWNLDWIKPGDLKNAINPNRIVDRKKLDELLPIVPVSEFELFVSDSDYS